MKKFIMLAAFLVLPAIVHGELRDVPKGPTNVLPSADYGGVDIATVTLSSANVFLFGNTGGSIAWIHFASAPTTSDFISFRSTKPVTFFSSNGTTVAVDANYLTAGAISGNPSLNPAVADFSTTNEVFRVFASTFASAQLTGGAMGSLQTGFDYVPAKPFRIPNGATAKLSSTNFGLVTIGFTKFNQ